MLPLTDPRMSEELIELYFDVPDESEMPAPGVARIARLAEALSRDGVARRRRAQVSLPPGPFRGHPQRD
jgi:hypothetical protein